jgi:alkaline phosphatase/streptomycin-6-phosphatase
LELAQQAGYKVGNVTTAELTDATPAVLNAHINDRGCQGPGNMGTCVPSKKENGGPGSIAEQSVDHHVNVLLGGGLARFQQAVTGGPHVGQTVVQSAQLQGYNVVFDAASLSGVSGSLVLGLFNSGNMSLEWSGLQATPFPGSGLLGGQTCVENQRLPGEPSLADMTAKAIDLLDDSNGSGSKRSGFFLQIEGASIDTQDHVETKGDQSPMTINYGTRPHGQSQDHTGSEVRIAALGPQAANVLGITNQTDLFHTMARALGLE